VRCSSLRSCLKIAHQLPSSEPSSSEKDSVRPRDVAQLCLKNLQTDKTINRAFPFTCAQPGVYRLRTPGLAHLVRDLLGICSGCASTFRKVPKVHYAH